MRMADPDGTEQAKKITASFLVFVGEQGELLVPQGRFGQFFENPARRKFRARLEDFVPSLVELDEQGAQASVALMLVHVNPPSALLACQRAPHVPQARKPSGVPKAKVGANFAAKYSTSKKPCFSF